MLIDLNYARDTTSGARGSGPALALRALDPTLPVVVMTAWGSVEGAVEAMRRGARDYVQKPWDNARLVATLRTQIELARRCAAPAASRTRTPGCAARRRRSSPSRRAMQAVLRVMERVAPSDANVLITGEHGTGKEVVARYLHAASQRAAKPFVAVNAGGLAEGVFESELFGHVRGAFTDARADRAGCFELADGGTLFLDEIGNMPLGQQAKLLRVLQTGEFSAVGSSHAKRVRRAGHRRHQRESPRGRRGPLPRGPALPPEHRRDPPAAAARAARGHSRSSRSFSSSGCIDRGATQARRFAAEAIEALRDILARQRARARARRRARGPARAVTRDRRSDLLLTRARHGSGAARTDDARRGRAPPHRARSRPLRRQRHRGRARARALAQRALSPAAASWPQGDVKRLAHDPHIFLLAIWAGLPAVAATIILLWTRVDDPKTRWSVAALVVLVLVLRRRGCARERVLRPLQTAANLLGRAARGGLLGPRPRRSRRRRAGRALPEINQLADTMHSQRSSALEAGALLRRVMDEIDVAVLAFDSKGHAVLGNLAAERLLGVPLSRLLESGGLDAERLRLKPALEGESPRVMELDPARRDRPLRGSAQHLPPGRTAAPAPRAR